MDLFAAAYGRAGYSVVRNKVFGGGYTTRHYGGGDKVDPVCVEHRCSTYLPEDELDQPVPPSYDNAEFRRAKVTMKTVYAEIVPGISEIYAKCGS